MSILETLEGVELTPEQTKALESLENARKGADKAMDLAQKQTKEMELKLQEVEAKFSELQSSNTDKEVTLESVKTELQGKIKDMQDSLDKEKAQALKLTLQQTNTNKIHDLSVLHNIPKAMLQAYLSSDSFDESVAPVLEAWKSTQDMIIKNQQQGTPDTKGGGADEPKKYNSLEQQIKDAQEQARQDKIKNRNQT